ncbi:YfgM family protein [Cognatiluteimonas telluris]|jgi:predicted negative regulator of RcsB-dependent stress response|uniref:YfgM family protein n=1 Tax=Cognatiluteimonas telluris TaxID=1104775 RepID=UPI00140AC3C6|nr:tetratricopeptide repeat protein [Lysobacter telluris]
MAIDDLLDEHEQSEKVRTWLQENALGLIGGVVLGLALIAGWQWWQQQQQGARIHAGEVYQATVDAIQAGKLKPAQSRLSTLDRGAYAALAAMGLAKAQLAAGKRDDAIATLQSNPAADPALGAIQARRLARLLVDAGKADQALKMLPANSTDAAILQVRGDAHYALGQRDKAGEAYAQALANLKADAPERRLVELKLSEVGGTPPKPKAKS